MAMRDDLHRLIDDLPEPDLPFLLRLLQGLRGVTTPYRDFLDDAPDENEAISPEEEKAMRSSMEAAARGETHAAEEVERLVLG